MFMVACALVAPANAADSTSFKVGGITFTRPATWTEQPVTSIMRKEQLKVPGTDAKLSADIAFFEFDAGSGGATQANIDRWLTEFTEPKDKLNSAIASVIVGKTPVTYVSAEGTYNSGMPGQDAAPKPENGLLGAIVGSPDGSRVFVKMTGPKATVKSATDDFKKMVESGLK